jgi:GT2 family glycosyltransferase
MTTVDITILSWDRLDETKAAIKSALSQTGITSRVIVVDQGSQPENLAQLRNFCRQYERIDLVCNQHNLGVPGGRNQAAWQGDGEYIVALDNDAEFIDTFQLAIAAEIMNNSPQLGAIGFRILRFGTDQDDLSSWSYEQPVAQWFARHFYTTHFVGAGHMIRRRAFDQVQGYDAALFFLQEEAELSRKLINSGYKIRYTPEVVIGHKVSAERRVIWRGPRWRYFVRNQFYLDVKFRRSLASLSLSILLTHYKGLRSGLLKDSMVGFLQGLAMLPKAIKAWRLPGVRTNSQALEYLAKCAVNGNQSRWQRIRRRLRKASVEPGQQVVGSK